MKSGLVVLFALLTAVAYGQDDQWSNSRTDDETSNAQRAALRKELNAPERSNFQSDEAYSEAKKAWIEANPEAYNKLISPPQKASDDRKLKEDKSGTRKEQGSPEQ